MGDGNALWHCVVFIRKYSLLCVGCVDPVHSSAPATCNPPGKTIRLHFADRNGKFFLSSLRDAFTCYTRGSWSNLGKQTEWPCILCSKAQYLFWQNPILFWFVFVKDSAVHSRDWVGWESKLQTAGESSFSSAFTAVNETHGPSGCQLLLHS